MQWSGGCRGHLFLVSPRPPADLKLSRPSSPRLIRLLLVSSPFLHMASVLAGYESRLAAVRAEEAFGAANRPLGAHGIMVYVRRARDGKRHDDGARRSGLWSGMRLATITMYSRRTYTAVMRTYWFVCHSLPGGRPRPPPGARSTAAAARDDGAGSVEGKRTSKSAALCCLAPVGKPGTVPGSPRSVAATADATVWPAWPLSIIGCRCIVSVCASGVGQLRLCLSLVSGCRPRSRATLGPTSPRWRTARTLAGAR
jgi:hypothetical protein